MASGSDFAYLVGGGLLLLIVALLLIGRFYPGTGAEVLDWRPTRSVETEAELELDDVDQMLAAQNERRRRRGLPERTVHDIELQVAGDLREQRRRHDEYVAGQEAGPEAQADLQDLLAATNRRRERRGQPPLTVEQLRAELRGPAGD